MKKKRAIIKMFFSWIEVDPIKEELSITTKTVNLTESTAIIPNNAVQLRDGDKSINLN